ncbi:MAG: putative ABC transport system permease protein [Arcticibacterium sp.]|jgi:putative ABC transport system permease protein
MLKNYIKIAWRNLRKHQLFSFINIVGLGIAIPFALLALIQLQGSFEFDNFHKDTERIVRIITDQTSNEGALTSYASSPINLENKLSEELPGVEQSTKVIREFGWVLSNKLKARNVNTIYTDPEFFEIFNFH